MCKFVKQPAACRFEIEDWGDSASCPFGKLQFLNIFTPADIRMQLILQARVPELLALWTDNGTSDEIVITDMDSATTQQFLEYVYTDSIKSVADQELTAVKGVLELLTFAEKYALQPFMRYLCRIAADQLSISEDQNSKSMDTRLVQELLQFSEAASSDYLKLKCTECLLLLEADNTPAKVTQEKKIKKRPGCSIC